MRISYQHQQKAGEHFLQAHEESWQNRQSLKTKEQITDQLLTQEQFVVQRLPYRLYIDSEHSDLGPIHMKSKEQNKLEQLMDLHV